MTDPTIGDFLTRHDPLGPSRHERILRRFDDESSNILVFKTKLFDQITSADRPIIIGRRGAGKTAVVNALLAEATGRSYSYGTEPSGANAKDIIVFLNSWDHFDALVEKVGNDLSLSHGPGTDWSGVLHETSARVWSRHLWHVIFQKIYHNFVTDEKATKSWIREKSIEPHVEEVNRYITGKDFIDHRVDITQDQLDKRLNVTRDAVIRYLETNNARCIIIIDSLEDYPVGSQRFARVISGFLRCINDFPDANPRCHIYCCLPEEIEPFVKSASPNLLKDGSGYASTSRLRWRPADLLRVVGKRYREFLKIHLPLEDRSFIEKIDKLELDERDGLRSFFDFVLPKTLINRYGMEEKTLAYIIRHSQLLPREFLLIFSSAIVTSQYQRGTWRYIEGNHIVESINRQEEDFAQQVLTSYRTMYPQLCHYAKSTLAHLPPIFFGRDLATCRKLENLTKHEVGDCWSALFSMGVIGYLEDESTQRRSHIYEFARFHFNSTKGITIAPDRRYCFHPVFSGSWHLRNHHAGKGLKFVYPASVDDEIVD